MTYQQSTSPPYPPQPHLESQAPQPNRQGIYGTPQQGQYYPPPPPRPPPSFQYGAGSQGSYAPYDRPSQGDDSYSAELEGTVPQTTPFNAHQPRSILVQVQTKNLEVLKVKGLSTNPTRGNEELVADSPDTVMKDNS